MEKVLWDAVMRIRILCWIMYQLIILLNILLFHRGIIHKSISSIYCIIAHFFYSAKLLTFRVNGKPDYIIYNFSNDNDALYTNRQVCACGIRNVRQLPLKDTLWYPNVVVTCSKLYFYFMFYFYQLLPSVLLDGIIILARRNPL